MAQPTKKASRPWFDKMHEMSVQDFRKALDKQKKEAKGNVSAVVNYQDAEDKTTALHTACRIHRKDLVEILLSEHADPNLVEASNYTPLLTACCEESNDEIIKLLLQAPGIDVTRKNVDDSTALHYFARNYSSPSSNKVAEMLITKGAGVNDQNMKGETPLMLACLPLKPRPYTARLLLENGADPNIGNRSGDTPLSWAVAWAEQELISLFLEKGANPISKDRAGRTPAEIADQTKRANIANMLRQAEQRWLKQKELETWLTGLGLTRYLPLFKKEEFDMSSISEIDEAVLQQLGLPTGHRLTFMRAKKELLESQSARDKPAIITASSSSGGPGPSMADRKTTNTLLQTTHIINFSDITMGRLLGKGFFAEVREGEYRGSPVAVKIIYRESFRNKGDIELFYQEAEILSKLRFPTVVQFIGICIGDQHCIITEYMKDGSLYQKLHDYPDDILRSHKWQLQIALDIARGMNYLHGLNPPVLHRDLTSKNILLDGKIAKVADFGLSKEKEAAATMTASVGALPWAAPEVFKGALFTEAADTYSYGVILWELWSGKDPQGDLAPLAYANKVAHESYRPLIPSHTPVAIKELIVRCWDGDPKKRPSFDEILKYLKAYEASHDRHGSTKDKKERREKGDKNSKKSTGRPVEPSKVPSESNLLGTYGGNPTPSVPERTNSDISLLQSYGQDIGPSAAAAANDSYINSGFSTSKSQSNPEGSHDLGKSQSADQLRKLSDSELTGSGRKNDVLKGSGSSASYSSQSDGDLVGSGRLRFSSADASISASSGAIPTIAVPQTSTPADSGSGGRSGSSGPGKHQLRSLHERGPAIFHNPSGPKSKDASPTHLRRVSMDDGNRSPLREAKDKGGGDSPKSLPKP